MNFAIEDNNFAIFKPASAPELIFVMSRDVMACVNIYSGEVSRMSLIEAIKQIRELINRKGKAV